MTCAPPHHAIKSPKPPGRQLLNPHDAIIKVTRTAICGSDLHLFDGFIPTMEQGDIMSHEFMGIVEEAGQSVTNLKLGDRVVVPFTIACGQCLFCKKKLWAACDRLMIQVVEYQRQRDNHCYLFDFGTDGGHELNWTSQ